MKYTAKQIKSIETKPGCWNYTTIGIFCDDVQIGEYQRNYPECYNTFYPFEINGQWYALYSPHYTCTRVMTLPDCKDWCGENNNPNNFCPTDFYIPELCIRKTTNKEDPVPIFEWNKWREIKNNRFYYPGDKEYTGHHSKESYLLAREENNKLFKEWMARNPYIEQYANYGFIAGCHWGDDWSWKIRFIDLCNIENKRISIDDRFGYIWLPESVSLKDAINISAEDDCVNNHTIKIALPTKFKFTGEKINEDD